MTAVNAAVAGDFRDRKSMTSLKVLKEIDTDLESNASSEDMEAYSPKSVVVKKVSVTRVRINNPIMRIRSEDRKIGEDIGEGFVIKFVSGGNDRVDMTRSISPLGGKATAIGVER